MTNIRNAWLILCLSIVLFGCTTSFPLNGNDAVCDALKPALFDVSRKDTRETKRSYANFLDVFEEVCKG